jgi:hypothetical protein
MDSLYNFLLSKTLKSDYFKAWILAQARHAGTALGTWLVFHGLANNEMAQDITGFLITASMFYLANLDVKVVDGKIKVALETIPPTVAIKDTPVEVHVLPDVPK